MGIYQAGPAGTYALIFPDAYAGSGQPGGAINSIQYNIDGVNFGGFGTYNSGTGLVTLPQHLILEGDTNANFQVNNVTFIQDGDGTQFLSNDGSYKSVTAVDNNFAARILSSADGTLFTFPSASFNDLTIAWDSTNQQPIIINGDGLDQINYTFRATWDLVTTGYPANYYQTGQVIAGFANIILTDTNDYVVGLDLTSPPSNIDLYLSIQSLFNNSIVLLKCTILQNQYADESAHVEIFGNYEVL